MSGRSGDEITESTGIGQDVPSRIIRSDQNLMPEVSKRLRLCMLPFMGGTMFVQS
jgi:hypothetical protein